MNSKTQSFLYIAFVDKSEAGVYKKVKAQFAAFRSFYRHAQLLILSNKDADELDSESGVETVNCYHKNPLVRRQIKVNRIQSKLNSLATTEAGWLKIYFRYPGADYFAWRLLKRNSHCFWIFEHQSIVKTENLAARQYFSYLNESVFQSKVMKSVQFHVVVHSAIAKHYGFKSDFLVVNNGVDVNNVKPLNKQSSGTKRLRLLFIGNIQKWHGLDRLLLALSEYQGPYLISLDIIGKGGEEAGLKQLVESKKMSEQVIFHGYKTGDELDRFFDHADLAIGSLAIHRAGVRSPLKIKEYCARGIPFIDSTKDPDFDIDFPFRLEVASE